MSIFSKLGLDAESYNSISFYLIDFILNEFFQPIFWSNLIDHISFCHFYPTHKLYFGNQPKLIVTKDSLKSLIRKFKEMLSATEA